MRSHDRVGVLPHIAVLASILGLTACPPPKPSDDGAAPKQAEALPGTDRVVQHGEDLYAEGNAPNLDSNVKRVSDGGRNPGAGIPDESNGVCRLFDPKLPQPECCKFETGFDVDDAIAACGFIVYMGEAAYGSCGYHFSKTAGDASVALRAAPIINENMENAVRSHDRQLQRASKDPKFKSTPIPGIPGAKWSRLPEEGLNWAHIPGWSMPRRVSWHDRACEREAMIPLLKNMTKAVEPPEGAERAAMVPRRRR
jgi:hypothetical protein